MVTDIGDFDGYLDDCGADAGGTATNSATLRMTGRNIGDLLNAQRITWGWFQGGFRPMRSRRAFNPDGSLLKPAVCGATQHRASGRAEPGGAAAHRCGHPHPGERLRRAP